MSVRWLAIAFAGELAALGLLGLVQVDRRVHRRDTAFGVNQWGYRSEMRVEREPGEIRVAILGGSAAFEAGVDVSDTFAGRPSKEAAATPSEQRESRGGQQAEGAAGQEAPDDDCPDLEGL